MVEFTLRNVTMILVVALVAGVALGCLVAVLRSSPVEYKDPGPEYPECPLRGAIECRHAGTAPPLDPATIDPRYRAVREGDDLDH